MSESINKDQICAFSRVLRQVGMVFMRVAGQHSSAHASYSKQELLALGMVAMAGPCRMGDIAASLGVGQSAVTPLIDRLEEAGLVERQRSKEDRRVWLVALTKSGKKEALKEEAVYEEVAKQMLAPLETAERNQLIELMGKVGLELAEA